MTTNKLDFDCILAVVRELLDERFGIAPEKSNGDALIRNLGLDSMMVMDLMLEAEDRLGVKLADLAMPRDPTLGDVVKLIERNLAVGA